MTNYEDALSKNKILDELKKQGWNCVAGKTLDRAKTEPLLTAELQNAIVRINSEIREIPLTDTELSTLIEELRRKTASANDCAEILRYLRKGIPFKPKSKGNLETIQLISLNSAENTYTAAYEVTSANSRGERIRSDILLYINGIPIADIECKDPSNMQVSWADAYRQIKRYQATVPELYKYVQIGITADAKISYFPTTPWETKENETRIKMAEWDEENPCGICAPAVLTNIIKNYTFVRTVKGTDSKILPRFIQYRAVEKIVNRVRCNLAGKDAKNKGLIWHWQGSGKTLTMTYAAYQLFNLPELEKPTIFFVSDRDDLQTQLKEYYESVKGLPGIEKIKSIQNLIDTISADSLKGKREIFTVLVQKFRPKELRYLEKIIAESKGTTIRTRKNIILLIDEAHRTQEGILSGEMRNSLLQNAFAFAFTGTPNTGDAAAGDKTKNTFTEFSYPPDEEYLDKYDMESSISDKFTLPLTYRPCLTDAKSIEMYDEAVREYLSQYFDDVDDAVKAIKEESIKKQLRAYKLFLENPSHIQKVSEKIAAHYKKIVEPAGFKALLICASRKACVLYKKELDRLFGDNKTAEVVMTYEANEKDPLIREFQREQQQNHIGKSEKEFTDAYRDSYKECDLPKILIVTDKLITGFDADQLQTIYLDKLLKGNKLLQAITRCNRPREGKDYGLIIDFAGILRHIEKALSNYNRGSFGNAIINKDELAKICVRQMNEMKTYFGDIPCETAESISDAVKHLLRHPELCARFKAEFLRLRRVRKYVESNADIVRMTELYEWFEHVYSTYTKLENSDRYQVSGEEMTKIYGAVHENVSTGYIRSDMPEKRIAYHPSSVPAEPPKDAVNIVFELEKFILTDKSKTPAYETLYEKIRRKVAEWKEEKITDMEICSLYDEVILKEQEISEAAGKSGLTETGFALFMSIKETWGENETLKDEVKTLEKQLQDYLTSSDWRSRPTAVKEVERGIKGLLRRYGKANGKTVEEIDSLFEKITRGIE